MEVINNNPQMNRPNRYPPKNHLVEAILVTLFCCLPFGIVGIINAARVENAFYSGDEMEQDRSVYGTRCLCALFLVYCAVWTCCGRFGLLTKFASVG